jgi:sulfite exporter TauE/SafE
MDSTSLYSMFILGILGTGHCLGMCGPLVVAFPMRAGGFLSHVYYHAGRIVTYVVVGTAMGGLGAGVTRLVAAGGGDPLQAVARIQVGLSLVAALFLFCFGLNRLGYLPEPAWMSLSVPSKIPGYRLLLGLSSTGRGRAGLMLLGMMLGLLPCGLSFAAFARALASADPWSGAALVLFFGLGTLPGLLVLGTTAAGIIRRYRVQSEILAGLLMIAMAARLAVVAIGRIG